MLFRSYYDSNYTITILKFESLEEDFLELMKNYNMSFTLNKWVNRTLIQYVTVKDISIKNIELIQTVYKSDFTMFGYPIDLPQDTKV